MCFMGPRGARHKRASQNRAYQWLFFLSFSLQAVAFGATDNVVVLTDTSPALTLSSRIDYFEDPSNALRINDVMAEDSAVVFEPVEKGALNAGFTDSTYWGRAQFRNNSSRTKWYFVIDYPLLDNIAVFFKGASGKIVRLGTAGDQRAFGTRPIKVPLFVFEVEIPRGEEGTLLFSVTTEGALCIPASMHSFDDVIAMLSKRNSYQGLYFGVVLILVLYGFVFFFYFRRPQYLVFMGLSGAQLLWLMGESGLLFQYVFPNWPEACDLVMVTSLLAIAFLGFYMDKIFLHRALTAFQMRTLDWALRVSGGLLVLSWLISYGLSVRLAVGVMGLYMGLSTWLALSTLLKGYKPARIFFVAICFCNFSGLLIMFRSTGVLPLDGLSLQGPLAGVGGYTLMMSLALTDKISLIQKAKDTLSQSFEKFVPKTLVTELMRSGQVARLGGEEREVTILFSDLRGYSTIIENLEPATVVRVMTKYFDAMQQVVEAHDGVILEFTGDGVLAVFGAPSDLPAHSEQGARCALAMRAALVRLNAHWEERNIARAWTEQGFDRLHCRIGVHTGKVIAGNLGSRQTMKYGVVGDSVNVAARLETLNKELGTDILVSDSAFARLSKSLQSLAEPRGQYELKGRTAQAEVYSFSDQDDPGFDEALGSVDMFGDIQFWSKGQAEP